MRPGTVQPPGLGKRLRAMAMGLGTVTGLARRGYFLPYRYAGRTDPGAGLRYDALAPLFDAAADRMGGVLNAIRALSDDLRALSRRPPPAPRWDQGWFPRLDAAAAYAIVRTAAPGRIVEVGSGHSTRFLAAAAADSGRRLDVVAIDPAPRAAIEGLGVEIVRKTLQEVDVDALIEEGDLLFIDSSHLLMPGSDVDILLNRVWPRLPEGVLVHFHDIFLPDDYPAAWRWRGYNEQLALGALLAAGGAEIVFSSHYALTRLGGRIDAAALAFAPLPAGALESSLWLRKRGGPVGSRS